MNYWKLGCNWGKNAPDFYDILIKHSIVIFTNEKYMLQNDIVAIARGQKVYALARIIEPKHKATDCPELKDDFIEKELPFEDWLYVAKSIIYELDVKEQFSYRLQQGICQIRKQDIKSRIDSINKFNNQNEMLTKEQNERLIKFRDLLEKNHNIIFTGAPGTGKTYLAKEIAKAMGCSDNEIGFVQFHPSYDYTDFVEGLRPMQDDNGNVGFERKNGVFKAFCERALKDSKKKFVFIIDEINRGEISKIFGELFFSIDPGYRGKDGMVETQYQNMIEDGDTFKKGFFVPENVYIIGTMNDIDRSVESMDFAFRRRFAFKEVTAKESQNMLDSEEAWAGKKPDEKTIQVVKDKMDSLNKMIWHKPTDGEQDEDKSIDGLFAAYHIGANYFLKLANYKNGDGSFDFDQLWEYHLEGLLFEYLRGATDIYKKIKKLAQAYGYTKADKYE